MLSDTNYFKIGLFFLVSVFLFFAGLFWIGSVTYLQETEEYVTYVDASVEGVSPGSQVRYRGLEVGRVEEVALAPDGRLIQVDMALYSDFQVNEAIAAQLKLRGMTGERYLSLVEAPENLQEVTPSLEFEVQRRLIPSVPGRMERVTQALQNVYRDMQDMQMRELTSSWRQVAVSANQVLQDEDLDSALSETEALLGHLRGIASEFRKRDSVQQWERVLHRLALAAEEAEEASASLRQHLDALPPESLPKITGQTRDTLHQIQVSTNATEQRVEAVVLQLRRSIVELNRAISQVRSLAETLESDPGRLLLPPEESEDPFGR